MKAFEIPEDRVEELRDHAKRRDDAATKVGVGILELDDLKEKMRRMVNQSLADEEAIVNLLMEQHGIDSNDRVQLDLENGQLLVLD